MRPAFGLVLLAASPFPACKGTSSSQGEGQYVARVEVAPVAVLLTTVGQTQALGSRASDAQGGEVKAAAKLSSSRLDDVAMGLGGSLVVVAQPAPGAVLVTAVQVVSSRLDAEVPGEPTRRPRGAERPRLASVTSTPREAWSWSADMGAPRHVMDPPPSFLRR